MNESKKGAIKAAALTFTLTLIATVIGGVIVEHFIRSREEKMLAQKEAEKKPRQVVTTTVPVDDQPTV